MANSIQDVEKLFQAMIKNFESSSDKNSLEKVISITFIEIALGKINEADYIKQWSEHDGG